MISVTLHNSGTKHRNGKREKLFSWRTWGELNFRDAATSGTDHWNVSAQESQIFQKLSVTALFWWAKGRRPLGPPNALDRQTLKLGKDKLYTWDPTRIISLALDQARKRHININFLVRLLLGHPGNVPGTNRVCPRDKVGFSQGQTQVFFLFYTAESQFVPGTNPVCPWDIPGTKGGRQSLCVKSLCAFFVPY